MVDSRMVKHVNSWRSESIIEATKKVIATEKRKQFIAAIGGKPYDSGFLSQLNKMHIKEP